MTCHCSGVSTETCISVHVGRFEYHFGSGLCGDKAEKVSSLMQSYKKRRSTKIACKGSGICNVITEKLVRESSGTIGIRLRYPCSAQLKIRLAEHG